MANSRDKETVAEKIDNGNVKVKGQKQTQVSKTKKEQPKTTPEGEKLNFTEEQILNAVRSISHPASSREVSDKLGIKDPDQGRAYVRSRMKTSVKAGKIKTSKPKEKSCCTFLYYVAQ